MSRRLIGFSAMESVIDLCSRRFGQEIRFQEIANHITHVFAVEGTLAFDPLMQKHWDVNRQTLHRNFSRIAISNPVFGVGRDRSWPNGDRFHAIPLESVREVDGIRGRMGAPVSNQRLSAR